MFNHEENFQPKEKKVSSRGCDRDSALGQATTREIRFLSRFSNDLTLTVDEYDGLYPNTLFQAAEMYLCSVITPDTKRFRASKPEREKRIKVSMEKDEEVTNWFGGVPIKWRLFCKDTPGKYVANPDSLGYEYGAVTQKSILWHHAIFNHSSRLDPSPASRNCKLLLHQLSVQVSFVRVWQLWCEVTGEIGDMADWRGFGMDVIFDLFLLLDLVQWCIRIHGV